MNKHIINSLSVAIVVAVLAAILDFWYKPTLNKFHKIIKAFKEYGFDVSELEEAFFDPKKTFLRFPTPGFRTALLPSLAGDISFNEAKEKAEKIELDGVSVPIIGYDDLVRSKTFSNRLKDQADIEELAKRKRGRRKSLGL